MTAADVQKCDAGSITICPADRALYDIRSITCESKLYFQTTTKDGPCKRSLMLHYETLPCCSMEKYGSTNFRASVK